MKKSLLLTCILLGSLTVPLHAQTQPATTTPDIPAPAHPATVEQIHEYFTITHSLDTAHKMMGQMVDAMQATGAPYIPKSFWDDLRSGFATFDLETPLFSAYQKYFSEEDMRSLISFYKSPAGQRFLQAQPLIAEFSREQFRKAGEELGRQVYERHKDEIEAARSKYEQGEHPPAQPNSSPVQPPVPQK